MNYIEFASRISFFEFIQEEFSKPSFKISNYAEEFEMLKQPLNIDILVDLLKNNPKTFDIFEQSLQLLRFTNAQYIHFLFDTEKLNNCEIDLIKVYAQKSMFCFENDERNEKYSELFNKNYTSEYLTDYIYSIKKSVSDYADLCIKNKELLYYHIINSINTRIRIANYLIYNLKLDEFAKAVDFKKYLEIKRKPKDTKNLHGKYGGIKISNSLLEQGIVDVSNKLLYKNISSKEINLPNEYLDKAVFVKEKCIEGILKRKNKKLKKFDFIILKAGLPYIAIETNFYSTFGTKIQINVNEYTDLLEDIYFFNNSTSCNLNLCWITDGNFWLTNEGKTLFDNLKSNYFKKDFELLNYNLFKINLDNILNEI